MKRLAFIVGFLAAAAQAQDYCVVFGGGSRTLTTAPIDDARFLVMDEACPGSGTPYKAIEWDAMIADVLASPALTGSPTTPTASADDNDTTVASTAFVQGELNGAGGTSLTCSSGSCSVDTEILTRVKSANLEDPVAGDNGFVAFPLETTATTITKVWCYTDTGTATINIEERGETTPTSAGTDVLSASLVCDTGGQSACAAGCDVNTISNSSIDAYDYVNLQIDSVASTPGWVVVSVSYTVND